MLVDPIRDLFAETGNSDLFACLSEPENHSPRSIAQATSGTPDSSVFSTLQRKVRSCGIAGITECEKDLYRALLSKMTGIETPDHLPTSATTAKPQKKLTLPRFVARTPVQTFAAVVSDTPPIEAVEPISDMIAKLLNRGVEGRVLQCEAGQAAFTKELTRLQVIDVIDDPRAEAIAEFVHPAAWMLPKQSQRMLAAAARQLFGPRLDTPVDFLLVWTKDACDRISARTRDTGFAGDAIALATLSGIPVVNLAGPDATRKLRALLSIDKHEDYHVQY